MRPRVVLLTGDETRHAFAAAELLLSCDLAGVVSESKLAPVCNPDLLSIDDHRAISQHLEERDEAERRLLPQSRVVPDVPTLRLRAGGVNAPEVLDWVDALVPDLLVLFGTSIVRPPLLTKYDGRIVNVHLGLSPYYRGSATNFWPLVHGEPECVGATIHLAVQRVDAGHILAQVRPPTAASDRAHDLGTKSIIAAFALLPSVLRSYLDRTLAPQAQHAHDGYLCRRAAFGASAVRTMWSNFANGMMTDYVNNGEQRRRARPIVEFSPERV